LGHIEIVEKALSSLDIDKIVVVPTYLNPFKDRFFFTLLRRDFK